MVGVIIIPIKKITCGWCIEKLDTKLFLLNRITESTSRLWLLIIIVKKWMIFLLLVGWLGSFVGLVLGGWVSGWLLLLCAKLVFLLLLLLLYCVLLLLFLRCFSHAERDFKCTIKWIEKFYCLQFLWVLGRDCYVGFSSSGITKERNNKNLLLFFFSFCFFFIFLGFYLLFLRKALVKYNLIL